MDTDHLFPPLAVPEDLAVRAKERGWPEGLLQRVVDLRTPPDEIDWLLGDEAPAIQEIESRVDFRERLTTGTLRARKADISDAYQFAEVWANSPQRLGDWEVTLERSPNPFAQWRLQENVVLNVLLDRGLMVACQGNSRRNTYVDGKRVTIALVQAVRVRKEFRRREYSSLVQGGGGGPHPNTPYENVQYLYVRSENLDAYAWMRSRNPDMFPEDPGTGQVPGTDVYVSLVPATPFVDETACIRPGTVDDLPRCVELINRTHDGLDLFRPYTVEYLESRLDDGYWSPTGGWAPHVYAWEDFWVAEEAGEIVACAGLWDRGRDIREVWRRKPEDAAPVPSVIGEATEKVVAPTALLDFGYAEHRVDAMATLVSFLVGRTHDLGRTYLMAPLQFLPDLQDALSHLEPVEEHRAIQWWATERAPEGLALTKPYTDLGYW